MPSSEAGDQTVKDAGAVPGGRVPATGTERRKVG